MAASRPSGGVTMGGRKKDAPLDREPDMVVGVSQLPKRGAAGFFPFGRVDSRIGRAAGPFHSNVHHSRRLGNRKQP